MAKLARLIDDGKARIVIPQLIRTEWDGCKRKIETQIANEVVEARRFAMRFVSFMDEIESNDVSAQISSADPISMGRRIAVHRIDAIETILNSDATTRVPVSAQAETLAIKHALERKAPFRMRNSMADALIFLAAVEWASDEKPDKAVFVTHNTKDFSDEKRGDDDVSYKERLAPNLQSLVENNGMTFGAVIGRVLNDVEQSVATEAEVKRGEAVVARTRLKDDALEELMSGGAIAKLLAQQKKFEEMASGGAIGKMMEQQKKVEELASGGVLGKMLAQQKTFEEMTTGGAIAKMMDRQKKIEEMALGGAISNMLEQQKKFEEMTSHGAIAKMMEQAKMIEDMASGGAIGKIFEQQKKLETMTSGGAIGKMMEQQEKNEEMASGGAIGRLLEQQRRIEEMFKRFQ